MERTDVRLKPPANAGMSAALSVAGLTKSFTVGTGARPLAALGGVDLDVAPGECLMLLGPSGCGKSTLLRVIAGLEAEFEGRVAVGGVPVFGTGRDRGMVFQDHRLFPWLTVADNVGLALQNEPLDRAEKAALIAGHLELVGLSDFAKAFPGQLSGGMAQRVAIARALVRQPQLLLMDEPFGALDALTRTRMQVELERIWRAAGATLVFVTHDVDESILLGDRIAVMGGRPGRILHQFAVDLPRPRERTDPAFNRLKADILGVLETRH